MNDLLEVARYTQEEIELLDFVPLSDEEVYRVVESMSIGVTMGVTTNTYGHAIQFPDDGKEIWGNGACLCNNTAGPSCAGP